MSTDRQFVGSSNENMANDKHEVQIGDGIFETEEGK
eukprot:SAG22_NODE_19614_length_273_cov_0.758621_1_plen_35_part_01